MTVWLIVGLALSGVFVAAFYAWKDEYIARLKSEKALFTIKSECEALWTPKIQITGTSRILTPNEDDFDSVFRATIVSLGFNPIGSCVARLESITKQDAEIFAHVETVLTFVDSGAHYSGAKQLDYNIPAYLQIAGDKSGRIRMASNNHSRTLNPYADGKIQETGEYEIKITLSAHASVSVGASFLFIWTGDPNTSSLRLQKQWAIAPPMPLLLVPDRSASRP